METKTLKLSNPKAKAFYDLSMANFRKQYKDVEELTALHVNKNGKVFSGEWIDSKGIVNFCGGWAVDCVKIIRFDWGYFKGLENSKFFTEK